jgi:tRNA A37 threonylcarbamoyltransferase TsaD
MMRHKIIVCSYRVEEVCARTREQAIENVWNILKVGESIVPGGVEENQRLQELTAARRKYDTG